MLTWWNVENLMIRENPPSELRVVKTGMQCRSLLPGDVYEVTRNAGT